ncbi:HEAT repeat domain-containing protein [candidate division KSB1 bacterium]|nr:HEAT repeat domain-containing protein [candidate division KSB1 bacterium]
MIPPIGPIPPQAALAGHGFGWRDGWHGSSRQYRQYLSEDEEVRLNALRSLLNQDEKLALPEAQRLLQEDNWAIRAAVLEMLGEAESNDAVRILRTALQTDTDKRVKRAAIRALSQRDEPEAREALREILQK